MIEISAFQCSDGTIFECENKAKEHEDNLLGQELDGLLRLFELNIGRHEEYKALIRVMNKRKELKEAATLILKILNHVKEN
mgnify:CR=1 FL=1